MSIKQEILSYLYAYAADGALSRKVVESMGIMIEQLPEPTPLVDLYTINKPLVELDDLTRIRLLGHVFAGDAFELWDNHEWVVVLDDTSWHRYEDMIRLKKEKTALEAINTDLEAYNLRFDTHPMRLTCGVSGNTIQVCTGVAQLIVDYDKAVKDE